MQNYDTIVMIRFVLAELLLILKINNQKYVLEGTQKSDFLQAEKGDYNEKTIVIGNDFTRKNWSRVRQSGNGI